MGIITKMLNIGFGVAAVVKDTLNRDKLEEVLNELVEKGEMSREQAKQHVDNVMAKRQEDRKHIKEVLRSEVDYWKGDSSKFVSKEEFEEMSNRLKELESKMQ